MDGFETGVDGFVDVGNQLTDYLRRRERPHFERERETKRAIDSVEAFERRRDRVRQSFLDSIGGLPDRSDDPNGTVIETIEREGYRVELLTLEPAPGVHVTANCYVPDGTGPHPAVLFLCGHVPAAKTDELNQRACIELARNGVVVLILDPIGQGERGQFDDPAAHPAHVTSGVFAHSKLGQQCYWAGQNILRYMLSEARCGIDHLRARPAVDPDRIGVTGTSGGGTQTQALTLVEDRLAAAAPCCSVSERSEWLRTGKSEDPEGRPYGAITRGLGYDDFLTGIAPAPVCVGAAASDFFPIEGAEETAERVRRVYDRYDAEENFELLVRDGGHASVFDFGERIFEWFCDVLDAGPYEPVDDPDTLAEERLQCTDGGSVREAFPDERWISDLIADSLSGRTATRTVDRETLADRLRDRLDVDRERCRIRPRTTAREDYEGLTVERVFFPSERDPDVVVAGVLVTDPDADTASPAVVCYEDGTGELPDRADDVAELARRHGAALVFDPRGVGAVRHRDSPTWYATSANDYHEVYGAEHTLAHEALLLETSLFGGRIFDVSRAAEYLRDATDSESVSLVGEGVGAYHVLYAAVLDERVNRVELHDLGPSFRERVTSAGDEYDPRLTAYDLIDGCDVPHCLATLADSTVRIDGVDGHRIE